MKEFNTYHPIVNFIYFVLVITFSCVYMHPICLGISLVAGFAYSMILNGRKAVRFSILCVVPLIVFSAIINPAFNHEGVTILTYLPDGNPLTLESIVYGVAAAVMIASVILWFSCYNNIMTSDKFIYLFGKIMPSLSLILSMVLRFVPRFRTQLAAVSAAQKCIGRDISSGNILQKAKNGLTILSIMTTWALENAIETADSMKSRGYGLPNRTAFSNFRFDIRDAVALSYIIASGLYVFIGGIMGGVKYHYYPSMSGTEFSWYSISIFAAHLLLCIMPIIIECREEIKWKSLKSKI